MREIVEYRDLVACPTCDRLHGLHELGEGQSARCVRCNTLLYAGRDGVIDRMLATAVGGAVLMVSAVSFPFLAISRTGVTSEISVIDAAMSFSGGWMEPVAIAALAFIVAVPLVRMLLLAYALAPLRFGGKAQRGSRRAFRLWLMLKPWAMAEIFALGVAVALVKVGEMAVVHTGPALWAFAALMIVLAYENSITCKVTIWRTLNGERPV